MCQYYSTVFHYVRCVSLSVGDKGKRDEELFEEEYTKLKGQTDEHKYALIPKFYSKVTECVL